jgi:hypothetical protein
LLKARKKEMGLAVLVPGLPVQVQRSYNVQNQLVAKSPSGPATADDRRQHEPHRVPLHFTQAVTDGPTHFAGVPLETSTVSADASTPVSCLQNC